MTSGPGSATDTDTQPGAGERAQQAASTAADETKQTAGVAAQEVKSVAGEATSHARNLVGEARSQVQEQVDEQSRRQKDVLASTLGSFGEDLASMAENGSGLAADVASQIADRATSLSSHLDGHEPAELLDDVRRFARERPGAFLLGSLVAGVVAGRLLRGTADSIDAAESAPSTPSTPASPSVPSQGQPTQPYDAAVPVAPVGTTVPSSPAFPEGLQP